MRNLFRTAAAGLAAIAVIGLASCASLNSAGEKLGLDINFEEVYSNASTIQDRVYLTAGLYDKALVTTNRVCTGADAESRLQAACERAADVADRVSPGITASLKAAAVATDAQEDVSAEIAEHGVASPEVMAAAAMALTNLALEYESIRSDAHAFIKGKS